MSGALVNLAVDPDRRAATGATAHIREVEDFSLKAMVERPRALYREARP